VCRVVGLDPEKIPIFAAYRDLYKVQIPDPVAEGAGAEFKLDPPFEPAKGWSVARVPTKMFGSAARSFFSGRPVISQDLCRGCMSCVDNCAAKAITVEKDMAVIDGSKCIRCYCCHELCPFGAVEIKDPPRIAGAIMDAIFDMMGE
jgi:ferredoxin